MKRAARGLDCPAQGIRIESGLARQPQAALKNNNPNLFIAGL